MKRLKEMLSDLSVEDLIALSIVLTIINILLSIINHVC